MLYLRQIYTYKEIMRYKNSQYCDLQYWLFGLHV